MLLHTTETPNETFSCFCTRQKHQMKLFRASAHDRNTKWNFFALLHTTETPNETFSRFCVARKRLKEQIKENPANINLRGLYHSHSYAINTGVMEVLLVTFSCSIQVYIGYLKPNKSFYMKLAA